MTEQSDRAANSIGGTTGNIIEISERRTMKLSGVKRVEDFDKEQVNLETAVGRLVVRGHNLHIDQLLLEQEQLALEGEIDSLSFEEETAAKRRSWFNRLTK